MSSVIVCKGESFYPLDVTLFSWRKGSRKPRSYLKYGLLWIVRKPLRHGDI